MWRPILLIPVGYLAFRWCIPPEVITYQQDSSISYNVQSSFGDFTKVMIFRTKNYLFYSKMAIKSYGSNVRYFNTYRRLTPEEPENLLEKRLRQCEKLTKD